MIKNKKQITKRIALFTALWNNKRKKFLIYLIYKLLRLMRRYLCTTLHVKGALLQ